MARHTRLGTLLGAASLAFFCASATATAADPNGTWNWKFTRGDQSFELSLDLKADGEKLTGTLNLPDNNSIDIKEGSFKNDEVAFIIEFERNGNVRTSKYKGKVEGDTIKGTRESERDGQARTRDWEATRQKSK